jgi:mycoredoxin-dependent peroxiredoxin
MPEPTTTALAEGTAAPDFTLRDQHGVAVGLAATSTRRPVLLVFYSFAFTGVCTGELQQLEAGRDRIRAAGAELLAVSCDSMFALRVFAEAEGLRFPLLSDFWPHGEVARSYGVFDAERGCAVRGTFVIDRTGQVRWRVVNPIPDARDAEAYLTALAAL